MNYLHLKVSLDASRNSGAFDSKMLERMGSKHGSFQELSPNKTKLGTWGSSFSSMSTGFGSFLQFRNQKLNLKSPRGGNNEEDDAFVFENYEFVEDEEEEGQQQTKPAAANLAHENEELSFEHQLMRVYYSYDPSFLSYVDVDAMVLMFTAQDISRALYARYGVTLKLDEPTTSLSSPCESEIKWSLRDRRINEILDSEQRFLAIFSAVQIEYVEPILRIFYQGSAKQKAALGLTLEETQDLFGEWEAVRRFSQQLLAQLECVNLVRTPPRTGEDRALYVGRAFLSMASRLHVYLPAVLSTQKSLEKISAAELRLRAKREASFGLAHDFSSLWVRACHSHPLLHGQSIGSVLIMPVQRVVRYKMLLEELAKDCSQEAEPLVRNALEKFAAAAVNINEAVKSHAKVKDFFGEDTKAMRPVSVAAINKLDIKSFKG